jgi:hypothetical protein
LFGSTAVPIIVFTLVGAKRLAVGVHVPKLATIAAGPHKLLLASILFSITFVASSTTTSVILSWAVSGIVGLIIAYIASACKGPQY